MMKQILFSFLLAITLGVFAYTSLRIVSFFKLTKPFPVKNFSKRFKIMMSVAIGQTKIFRRPVMGLLHALVFWGFLVILVGSIEMVIDGISGSERALGGLGFFYDILMASGDVFALIVALSILVFLFRRLLLNVKRFNGPEMKHISHIDANIALTMILLLMVSLLGMNTFYYQHASNLSHEITGVFPVSKLLASLFSNLSTEQLYKWHEANWWSHILLIFIFANMLPYSKHFHVFMSVPNVFLSRLEPLGKLSNMESITSEVKAMMNPETAYAEPAEGTAQSLGRFGVFDIEDVTWKNYLDSLACTECGRCTSVCPANITGKKLSPRKIFMDLRARMKEKGPGLIKQGKEYTDGKSLLRDYISEEELWACTTCNACAQECPININHPSLIVDMRRYLVMEEAAAPGELNAIFTNIENNGAPWQFSPEDRMLWAEELYIRKWLNMTENKKKIEVPVMATTLAKGKKTEYLFWVGSAGAFDDRYKKVTQSFVKILTHIGVNYAVLGKEESSSGDVARRTGNEMLFQMQALMNIEILNNYGVEKIITCDPHVYNTFKNEYPDFGGNFEVIHHTQFLKKMVDEGRLKINNDIFKNKIITFHDPCYLGRANNQYEAPRKVLDAILSVKREMKRNKSFALCCGAGGGQMFKEAEKGNKEVFIERTEDALETGADIIATACPYCMTMMTDGLKYKNKEEEKKNYDIAELVALALGI